MERHCKYSCRPEIIPCKMQYTLTCKRALFMAHRTKKKKAFKLFKLLEPEKTKVLQSDRGDSCAWCLQNAPGGPEDPAGELPAATAHSSRAEASSQT